MSLALHLRPAARRDLEQIWTAGLTLWSPQACEQYVDGLYGFMVSLTDFPERYRIRHELLGEIRVAPYHSHIILYRIDGQIIDVVRIRHSHEDWQGETGEG